MDFDDVTQQMLFKYSSSYFDTLLKNVQAGIHKYTLGLQKCIYSCITQYLKKCYRHERNIDKLNTLQSYGIYLVYIPKNHVQPVRLCF